MERIKQAIEKINNQQSGSVKQHVQTHSEANISTIQSRDSAKKGDLESTNNKAIRVIKLLAEHLEKNRVVAFNKDDPRSMIFDLLRTTVLQKMEEHGWKTLAITSPTPDSGKSMVAINLAMSIAQLTDKNAILVDFDLRRPKIGSYLGISMGASLNELLSGAANLEDTLVNPDIPRLMVLPTKSPVKNSSEMLTSKIILGMIKSLRDWNKSGIVIFDLPPILVADDAIALLPQIDCVLMVVADGMSTKREIEDSLRHLKSVNLLGTVFNKAEEKLLDYYGY